MTIPPQKAHLLEQAQKQVSEIQKQYNNGVITDGERYNKVVDIWAEVQDEIGGAVIKGLSTQVFGKDSEGADMSRPVVQSDLYHGGFGRPRIRAADSSAGRPARPDGKAVRRNYRDAHHRQFPRRA